MFENTAHCIANCLRTSQRSHALYRSFGIEPIDGTNIPMRRDVLIQLSTYYPDVALNDVQITKATGEGHFDYNISIKGM